MTLLPTNSNPSKWEPNPDFEGYAFNVVDTRSGSVIYYVFNSQPLLDWILEPVSEDAYNSNGSFTVTIPDKMCAVHNQLFDNDTAMRLGMLRLSMDEITLGGADPLRAKALAGLSVMYRVDRDTYLKGKFPVHRTFYISNMQVMNRGEI